METSETIPKLPAGACDCHTHVFLDRDRFPMSGSRKYTPPAASIEALAAWHDRLGIERVVIVQPSVYGIDNAATLEALRSLGARRARGVAVIDTGVPDAELDRLHAAGVRGVRVNLGLDRQGKPTEAADQLFAAARRVAPLGWHVQVYAPLALLAACAAALHELPVPLVLDHHAGAHDPSPRAEWLEPVLELVASGRAYVKLSAPYRSVAQPELGEMEALSRRFIACNPERMLWGSDWPHPCPEAPVDARGFNPPHTVDNAGALAQLRRWSGDAAMLRRILVDNPERLYGFPD